MALTERQQELCETSPDHFDGLRAVLFNCSLKREASASHTGRLMDVCATMMEKNAVSVERIHMAALQVAFGVYPDMTEHGAAVDEWSEIWQKVEQADIIIIGTPI